MAPRMTSKPKNQRGGKSAAANDDTHDDDLDADALPTGDAIKAHLKSLSGLKAKVSEITGQIGAEVKRAESDLNIHRGAAAFVLKLHRMDEEKRDEFLRHFDSYRLQMGFGRQDDLFNDPTPESPAPALAN
ncbi:MAG TPA: hypothetical protein PKY87_08865 [Terricaulis sp.]|nr:hypothetical protein [Terricaulis sp.]